MSSAENRRLFAKLVRDAVAHPDSGFAPGDAQVDENATITEQPATWNEIVFDREPRFRILAAVLQDETNRGADIDAATRLLMPFSEALAQVLGKSTGRTTTARIEPSAALSDVPAATICVRLAETAEEFVLTVSAASLDALGAIAKVPANMPSNPVLDALMDVELPIRLVLGTRQIPLAEVLQLKAGAQVEFDNKAGDPVEVIVNNRVVARGDVVAIGGNYGVRISEIVRTEFAAIS